MSDTKRWCLPRGISISTNKGQITVYIIVGIILLFTVAGVLYITKESTTDVLRTSSEPVITSVPQTFQPIQSFTDGCIEQIAKRGLKILGESGGYIHPDLQGEFNALKPTESVGLNLESIKVPYWHYNELPNQNKEIQFASLQPKIKFVDDPQFSIEAQLARYVRENLDECLKDYDSFTSQGFEIQRSQVQKDVEVKINDDTVTFWVRMPIEVRKGDAKNELGQFRVLVNLPLLHYLEVAQTITQAQQNFSFLEKQGLELISIYSQKDPRYLAPTSGTGYDLFSSITWNEASLEESFTEILTSYVHLLQFLGSQRFYHTTFPDNRLAQHVVDNFVLPLEGAQDLVVRFDYQGWKPYFKTNSVDGVIAPEHLFVNYYALSFGTQRYETHYDVSYPVLVSLEDTTAFNGEGYTFNFALESNIRNNRPAKHGDVRENYPKPITPLACDEPHKDSSLLRTIIIDSETKQPLEGVRIGFSIPEQDECEIGITNEKGIVDSRYPKVYGGVINMIYQDHLTNFYPIDTYTIKEDPSIIGYAVSGIEQRVVEMHRFKPINVTVKKRPIAKCIVPLECSYTNSGAFGTGSTGALLTGSLPYSDITCEKGKRQCFFESGNSLFDIGDPLVTYEVNGSLTKQNEFYLLRQDVDLQETTQVLITLERMADIHTQVLGQDLVTTIAVSGTDPVEVELVPGVYKLTSIATVPNSYELPSEQRCFAYDIAGYEKEECFTIDGKISKGFVAGNMVWESPETFITITPEQLYSSDSLTLYMPMLDLENVPLTTRVKMSECSGFACLPAVGCGFEACEEVNTNVAARLSEDFGVISKVSLLMQQPTYRQELEPRFE